MQKSSNPCTKLSKLADKWCTFRFSNTHFLEKPTVSYSFCWSDFCIIKQGALGECQVPWAILGGTRRTSMKWPQSQRLNHENHRITEVPTKKPNKNGGKWHDNFMHKLVLSQYFGRFFGELHLIQTVTCIRFLYKLNGNLTKKITFISGSTQCICCFGKPAF